MTAGAVLRARGIQLVMVAAALTGCARTRSVDSTGSSTSPASPAALPAPPAGIAGEAGAALGQSTADAAVASADDGGTTVTGWSPPPSSSIDGPHEELSLDAGRPIYYAMSRAGPRPARLVGHLHGMCGPPPYACGKWIGAGTDVGVMVCPTGNARCGDSSIGPASWEAPTWTELVATMDRDLEAAVAKVEARRPGSVRKEGAVLTAYSRGAYAAPLIARRHPKRWPYLVLIEANVSLSAESLAAAGVRAVALVAGELGNEIAGMDKTQRDLDRAGFPSKLFVMRRTGHPYGEDMEYVMHDALAFVLSYDP